jgi:DNA-binding Xre family transcriptional regulator
MSYLNQQSLKPKRFSLANIQHFESFLLLVFFVLGFLGILNHAMWRDELNGWLIARDSPSLTNFWNNIRYEGHPILWYAWLNQITQNAIATLRKQSKLRRSDIMGLSKRQVSRIEKGEVTDIETLDLFAQAHQMELNDYLEAIANLMEVF